MTDLTPVSALTPVPQLEVTTLGLGGTGNPMNSQAQALLNRDSYRGDQIEQLTADVSGFESFKDDLQNNSDPSKGASGVGYRGETVSSTVDKLRLDSVLGLVGLVGTRSGDSCITTSFWPGWAALLAGPSGGAEFIWNPSLAKSAHNGGNIVSPTVPWDGTEGTFAAYIAASGESDPAGVGCWVHRNKQFGEYNFLQWGGKNDASLNGANDAVMQPLLNYIESLVAVGAGIGGVLLMPRGTYRFNNYFNVRDRTTIRGEGNACTILQFPAATGGHCITFGPTGPDHPTRPAGEHVFACRLEKLAVSGANVYKGLDRAMVYTDGAHEHSGVFECVIRDFTNFGIYFNTGNGGPAFFEVNSVEIYGGTTIPTSGERRGIYCNAGGAVIKVTHATITGTTGNPLNHGILMSKDHLLGLGVHCEYTTVGISLSQTDATSPRANTLLDVTGNSTVPKLVEIASAFKGSVSAHGVVNTSVSTTGLISLINQATGESFLDQAVASYSFGTTAGPGISISNGRINVSGGVASVGKAVGRSFTVSRTGAGVVRVTLSAAMPDSDYTVIPTARPTGGGAMFCNFSPVSSTQFDINTYNQAGTATDPATIWFDLKR